VGFLQEILQQVFHARKIAHGTAPQNPRLSSRSSTCF
jgi:hypothetical protein